MSLKKPGRPRNGEPHNRSHFIGFKVDDEGLAALHELERAIGDGHGKRSQAIRKALIEARDRLREGKR